jgi:hypothetical protein
LNEKVSRLLANNKNTKIILLSDSSSIANKLKACNSELFYWENKKIHLGKLKSDNVEQSVRDTLADFFIMTRCEKIYHYAFNGISGFSKLVSLIYDKEYIKI